MQSENDVVLACEAAIAGWLGAEGRLAHSMAHQDPIDPKFLLAWLKRWELQRTVPPERLPHLARFLAEEARPTLLAVPNGQPETAAHTVETLVEALRQEAITRGRPTSLMAGYAFSLRPDCFSPYDGNSRRAMGYPLTRPVQEHDYLSYMEVFSQFATLLEFLVRERYPQLLTLPHTHQVSERLFFHRSTDKLLQLLGGTDRGRLQAESYLLRKWA